MVAPRQPPATYLTENGLFPGGPYRRDTPREVFLADAVAHRLKEVTTRLSIRFVARRADLSPQTILNIINGKSWPDLRTIARLEIGMNHKLWGAEHRKNPGYYNRYYPNQ